MAKKIRKILRQMSAKKPVVGAVTVFMLLLLVTFSSMLVFLPEQAKAESSSDFTYSKSITIDHDQVPEDLSGFPILVHIVDDSDLYSHCLNDSGYDVAFFNETNVTQFPHEIEYWNWDTGNSEVDADIWVNVSSINSSVDTIFYMYYGNSTCSNQEDVTGVWDSDYVAVWHMNSTYDSTGNYPLTTHNQVTTSGGYIGDCYLFDGATDYLSFADTTCDFQPSTMECWFNSTGYNDDGDGYQVIFAPRDDAYCNLYYRINPTGDVHANSSDGSVVDTGVVTYHANTSAASVSFNNWEYTALVIADNNDVKCIVGDSGWSTTKTMADPLASSEYTNTIGIDGKNLDNGDFEGYIDEARISKINRSDAWIVTCYNSMNNQSDGGFLTFGSEQGEEGASSFSLKGLYTDDGERVTFNSTAGASTWCNATGPKHETCEVNLSINASDNVTEIRVWVNGTPSIAGSNFTLYASSDNSSFGVPTHNPSGFGNGVFADAGCNVTLNLTTWNDGTMGNNSFWGVGLHGPVNTSIYLRVIVTIPVGLSAGEYKQVQNAWKVYLARST